jgi:hypothetical protein
VSGMLLLHFRTGEGQIYTARVIVLP